MSDDIVKVPPRVDESDVERVRRIDPDAPAVGKWYWVTQEDDSKKSRWLACVAHMGSNYALLRNPRSGVPDLRVHLDEFADCCEPENNAKEVIAETIAGHRLKVQGLLGQIQETTAMLAIGNSGQALGAGETGTTALALAGGASYDSYKSALVKAKDETLPELFKQVKKENEAMAQWMGAELIPLEAEASKLGETTDLVKSRISNVELYAGLVEEVVQCADGAPAPLHEPIRLFQRRAYMDEECLAEYRAGGMSFSGIEEFDKWICATENRDRLLPFPRCIVAFQVRRNAKEHHFGSLSEYVRFVAEGWAQLDRLTFLYIRNGEKIFRLSTELDFGEKLFPDFDHSNLGTGQIYGNPHARSSSTGLLSESAYRDMVAHEDAEHAAAMAKFETEEAEYPVKMAKFEAEKAEYDVALEEYKKKRLEYQRWIAARNKAIEAEREKTEDKVVFLPLPGWENEPEEPEKPEEPHRPWQPSEPWLRRESSNFKPFNQSSVYYDDISELVAKEMEHHNRLVLVLQGLLDRSVALHPHPPWKLWDEKGFRDALILVYDDSRALTPGAKPDFEAYRKRLNQSLGVGSVTIGQEAAWLKREAERENERRRRHGGYRYNETDLEAYRPYGDNGPGRIAKPERASKGKLTYTWERDATRSQWSEGRRDPKDGKYYRYREYPKVKCTISVPADRLFNVSAYKPGDFRQFFADPRTRAEYLQWAPLLLDAEEFHAGNLKLRESSSMATDKYSVDED